MARLSVTIEGDSYEFIRSKSKMNGISKKRVLMNALTLYKYLTKQVNNGARLILEKDGKMHEVIVR